MHRSRLTAVAIDVPSDVHQPTAEFWGAALGRELERDGDSEYIHLGHHGHVEVFVQRLGEGGSRLHIDIETDDVEAEVSRLEALGAERVEQVRTWQVMRDPAGLLFCVVQPQGGDFPNGAATWP
jgi:predicted enzyme related to lactoylglutathione lyase